MAKIGDIPVKLRLRVEAGIGNAMTDVGHADMVINIPVKLHATGTTANVSLDTTELRACITDAMQVFLDTATTRQG